MGPSDDARNLLARVSGSKGLPPASRLGAWALALGTFGLWLVYDQQAARTFSPTERDSWNAERLEALKQKRDK